MAICFRSQFYNKLCKLYLVLLEFIDHTKYYSPKENKLTVFLGDNFKSVNNVYLRLRMKFPLYSTTTSQQKVMMHILGIVNSRLRR